MSSCLRRSDKSDESESHMLSAPTVLSCDTECIRTFVLWLDASDALDAALELGLCCFELSKGRREVLHLGFELLLDLEELCLDDVMTI